MTEENLTPEQQAEKEQLAREVVELTIRVRRLMLSNLVNLIFVAITTALTLIVIITGNVRIGVITGIVFVARGILDFSNLYDNKTPKLSIGLIFLGFAVLATTLLA